MSKELEEIKSIVAIHFGALGFLNPSENEQILKDRDKVLNALTELQSIKEVDSSEALNITKATEKYTGIDLSIIKQALQRLNKYEEILSKGRLTNRNYKNTTLDLDSCKPYLRLGQLEDIYEEGKYNE